MTILLGLTTTRGSDWQEKINEIDRLGLREISIFPTVLDPEKRNHLYKALEKTKLKSIPHAHIREQDTTVDELRYLSKRWKTEVFNTHPTDRGMEFITTIPEFKDRIFVENTGILPENFKQMVKDSGGICIDFSHWQDYWFIQKRADYQQFEKLVKKYPIGCCHLNAVGSDKYFVDYGPSNNWHYNKHHFDNLNEFDYLKNFTKYLPPIISLELENSFEEQLTARRYIKGLIGSY